MRGAVTKGPMFWHPTWMPGTLSKSSIPKITFGPALVEAHRMEKHYAKVPRILLSDQIAADGKHGSASPFASEGHSLSEYFITDSKSNHFLDLLHDDVQRNPNEKCENIDGNFSITLGNSEGAGHIRNSIAALAARQIRSHATDDDVRGKWDWLRDYAMNGPSGTVT